MRYSLRFPTLLRCCGELEKTARRHIREIENLRETRGKLAQLSGMEAVLAGIDRELAEMESQKRVLLTMAQAVQRARQIYTATEDAIIEETDCPYRALTELKFAAGGGGPGNGTAWQVTVSAPDGASQAAAVEIKQIDTGAYTALLAEMDVILKADW